MSTLCFYFTTGQLPSPGEAGTGGTGSGPGAQGRRGGDYPASPVSVEHVEEQVHHPVAVAVFVVVPGEGGGGSGDPSRALLVSPPSPLPNLSDSFPPYQEMSFTKLSLSAMPALASKTDEWVSLRKSVETTWAFEFQDKCGSPSKDLQELRLRLLGTNWPSIRLEYLVEPCCVQVPGTV